jgi:hypothetical protein
MPCKPGLRDCPDIAPALACRLCPMCSRDLLSQALFFPSTTSSTQFPFLTPFHEPDQAGEAHG